MINHVASVVITFGGKNSHFSVALYIYDMSILNKSVLISRRLNMTKVKNTAHIMYRCYFELISNFHYI